MTNALHDKIIIEYQKKQERHRADYNAQLQEIYKCFPALKVIDDEISFLSIKHANEIIKSGITPEEALKAMEAEKKVLLRKKNDLIESNCIKLPVTDFDCTICNDTGVIDGQKCKCYMETMKKLMLSNVDGSKTILFDFEKDRFENFSLEWYSKSSIDPKLNISPYDNMKSVYAECKNFCRNFDSEFKNLYFYGASGTGKTFMASCIANDLVSKGYKVVYQSAYKLFQFMEDYKFCRIERDESTYDSIYNCDVLIVDDLGTEFGTAYTCSVLFDILNTRLLNEKSTIISSNLSLGNLEQKYTDRIQSRIIGHFEILRFMGEDIRILKKQNRR